VGAADAGPMEIQLLREMRLRRVEVVPGSTLGCGGRLEIG